MLCRLQMTLSILGTLVGDVETHLHLVPCFGAAINFEDSALNNLFMAETKELSRKLVGGSGNIAELRILPVKGNGVCIMGVVGLGHES